MQERGRALRRHHRQRVIAHRLYILTKCWALYRLYEPPAVPDGKYAKFNLSCNCGMCKWHKWARENKRTRRDAKLALKRELAEE